MTQTTFAELRLHPALLTAVADAGFTHPTPIQSRAIPPLVEGRDILGVAQTGTGKTAAFALPILHRMAESEPSDRRDSRGRARTLVLTPTRELAIQIYEQFDLFGGGLRSRCAVVFGGVGQRPQVRRMERGVDVLVATPGRLLDLMGQGHIRLDTVEFLVLDEADRMLDMGFVHDVKRIVSTIPKDRQTLLFSATMPESIRNLSRNILRDPVRVEVTPPATTVERIQQKLMMVEKTDKPKLLAQILSAPNMQRTLVFTRTKHGANRVVKQLGRVGIQAAAIHGNKSQGARQRALAEFREGKTPVLVATDIAARGIDVEGISHVINFNLPNIAESYVHRIGRTARAGRDGIAIAFCDIEERAYLRDIEKLTGQPLELVEGHDFESPQPFSREQRHSRPPSRSRRRRRSGSRGSGHRPSAR